MFALSLSLSGLQAQLDGEEQESEKTIGNAITQTQSKDNLNEYSTGDTLERVQKGNFVGARQKKKSVCHDSDKPTIMVSLYANLAVILNSNYCKLNVIFCRCLRP